MKKHNLKIGDTFDTLAGTAKITGYNGHIAYVDETVIDYPEDENGNLDYENPTETIEKRMLTPQEIGGLMAEVDGQRHEIRFIDND